MSSPGLKAGGLVGVVVGAVGLFLGIIAPPLGGIGGILCISTMAAPIGAGALAACWLTPPRTLGDGAEAGAIAGMVTAIVGGIMSVAVFFGDPVQTMNELLRDSSISGPFSSIPITAYFLMAYCVGALVFGALPGGFSGIIVGMIITAAKSDQESQPTHEA